MVQVRIFLVISPPSLSNTALSHSRLLPREAEAVSGEIRVQITYEQFQVYFSLTLFPKSPSQLRSNRPNGP